MAVITLLDWCNFVKEYTHSGLNSEKNEYFFEKFKQLCGDFLERHFIQKLLMHYFFKVEPSTTHFWSIS